MREEGKGSTLVVVVVVVVRVVEGEDGLTFFKLIRVYFRNLESKSVQSMELLGYRSVGRLRGQKQVRRVLKGSMGGQKKRRS